MDSAFDEVNALRCELASEVLRSSGGLRLGVTGWSMLPAIWPGDTLEIESADCGRVSVGDLVLFHRERRLFVHRVVKHDETAILTRGDAMNRTDRLVTNKELLGRVSFIVRDGRCIPSRKTLSLAQRAVAGVIQHSRFGADVIVRIHGLLQR